MSKLEIPKTNYISSYDVALNLVNTSVESSSSLHSLIDICMRHLAGEKPNKPEELKRKGLSWVSNFNYGKARAKLEKLVAESSAKISNSIALGYCTFRNVKDSDKKDKVLSFLESDELRGTVAATIGHALSTTLAKETRLSGWLNQVEYPSIAFGFCPLVMDHNDWMPEPVHPQNIAFKPKTIPDDIQCFIVFKTVDASELYDRWVECYNEEIVDTSQDTAEKVKITSSGWNLAALEEVLLKAFKGVDSNKRRYEQWADVIPVFTQSAASVIQNTSDVSIAKIYYRELDGTLSEVYIPYGNDWQGASKDTGPVVIVQNENHVGARLYSKNHGTYKQAEWISLVRDSGFSETGFIQDHRGIAKYAVEDSYRYNKTRNTTNDKMVFIGSPVFEQSNTTQSDKIKITVSAGFLVIPPNANLVEKNFQFDINPHLAMLRFEEQEYIRDTQQFDATIQGRLTNRPNKGEVEQVTAEVQASDASKNSVKLKDYSQIFATIIKRLVDVECEDGDPAYKGKERFHNILKNQLPWLVKTDADVKKLILSIDSYVLEPVTSNIETITIAIQMSETPFARNRFKRMLLLAKGMPIEEVNIGIPLVSDKMANIEDARIAAFENDLFFLGSDKMAYGTDDHIVHIDSHLAKSKKVIEGFGQQQIKPTDAYAFLTNSLLHTQMHVAMLGEDPLLNSKAKEYQVVVNQYMQAKDQIGQAAQQQQEAEANTPPPMDPVTQEELRQENTKLEADIQRKNFVAQNRTAQANEKIVLDHQRKLEQIKLDNEAKAQKV